MLLGEPIQPLQSSFVYENLIARVKAIQQLATSIDAALHNRLNSEPNKRDGLKFRTFTFVDPYGNKMVHEHMDQELIANVLQKYKKDYVPKYLQRWIKIGIREPTTIVPIAKCDATSNLCRFTNGTEFVSYADLPVWIGRYETAIPTKLLLRVSMMDTIETIKHQVEERGRSGEVELRYHTVNGSGRPSAIDWEQGQMLSVQATVMSLRLYQENCTVMAKLPTTTVNDQLSPQIS
jgi:hypothetical protein